MIDPRDRLDFTLHAFARRTWVSDTARQCWEPRIQRITHAWLNIEWMSVAAGVRRCASTLTSPADFVLRAGEWATRGLVTMPLELHGGAGPTRKGGGSAAPGEPSHFRLIVGTATDTTGFKDAWDALDETAMAEYLGYPGCCTEFFGRVWDDGDSIDQTWATAVSDSSNTGKRTIEVTGPPEANLLWRWVGVRAVPHIPCGFDCAPSAELGRTMIEVGRKEGFDEEMDWLLEILSWPVEWSALHGIAEIKTPLLKVSATTDATRSKYVVRRKGSAYPEEGAQGLDFPFRMPGKISTESSKFHRGLDNPIKTFVQLPDWYATDNGFASLTAMERAYDPVIQVAAALLGDEGGNVLDLGCGNGARLARMLESNPKITPFGVERDPARVEHAHALLSQNSDHFVCGNVFEDEWPWPEDQRFALALLMPGRLLESGPVRAAELSRKIEACCDQLLVYAHDDWLTKYHDLRGLALRAGLTLLSSGGEMTASLARFRDFGEEPSAQ